MPTFQDDDAPMSFPHHPAPVTRAMWLGFAVVTGILFGAAAGLLSYVGEVPIPLAIITGGGAAGCTIALMLTLVRYATRDDA